MMPNILQNPVAVYGILRAGMIVVNVNPLYTPRELEHQLKDSGAKALFVLENFAHVAQQAAPKTAVRHVVVAAMGDLLGLKDISSILWCARSRSWCLPMPFPARSASRPC